MESNSKYCLYLPGLTSDNQDVSSLLAVDIREQFTAVTNYNIEGTNVSKDKTEIFRTASLTSAMEPIKLFLENNKDVKYQKMVIAVPGVVLNGVAKPDRIPFTIDVESLRKETGVSDIVMMNDVEASAYGLAFVKEENFIQLSEGKANAKGNVAFLAPGSGLGEAGLFYDGDCLRPFATEGGHSEFSPRTNVEVEFYQFLNNIYGIVSWEHVLSKVGMFNIYRFLRDVKRHPEPEWLSERLANGDFVTEVFKAATEENVLICRIALDTYVEFLAREASNLVLKLKATGGLVIGGDISILIHKYFNNETFYKKFLRSDKMEELLAAIPIYLLNDERTITKGAVAYAVFGKK